MKRLLSILLLAAVSLHAQTVAPAQLDTIFLNSGEKRLGRIVGIDALNLKVTVLLDPRNPAATASVSVPRKDIDHIEFAPNEALDKKLHDATPAQLNDIARLWQLWQPYLAVPKSPAADVGLVYGDLLLRSDKPELASQALDLFKLIETSSWNDDAKPQAGRGRLRAMIATGQPGKAIDEARKLAKVSEDPAVLVEAKFILAEASNSAYRKLVEDNPRWQLDRNILPERNRLYNESLELYLFPYLFYGSEIEPASRGLWGAIDLYDFTGEKKLARETALDLVTLYPGTKYAAQAQQFLDKNPEEAKPSTETKVTK
ncbi:hypothetical protein BH09VER1_BH09VER1_30660 [soil metagenome]